MTEDRLREILEGISRVRAGVVGDTALDAYWYADMRRAELSRETPHYNQPVSREVYSGGALANVAVNLAALGAAQVGLFTVLGADWRGEILKGILTEAGVDVAAVIWDEERFTTTFLKPMLRGHEAVQEAPRFDFLTDHPPEAETVARLMDSLAAGLADLDCVLLGDQVPDGVVTDALIERAVELARREGAPVFTADSRYRIERFTGMFWKPNEIEAEKALKGAGREIPPAGDPAEADVEDAARKLAALGAAGVFVTLGPQGCVAARGDAVCRVPGIETPPPIDIVGAGDAFHAAVAASLAADADVAEAGLLGNLAAAVTIRKIGTTGTASPGEILALFRESRAGVER